MAEVNVRNAPYNATGNGSTNDTAAIQAAINYARPRGDVVYIPAGTYVVNGTLTIDSSAEISDTSTRCSIRGDGSGSTRLARLSGTGPVIRYLGGNDAGAHAYVNLSDFMVIGNGTGTNGIEVNRAAFMSIERVTLIGCDVGLLGQNILSSTITRLVSRWNKKGFRFERAHVNGKFSSDPNGITMLGCIIGNNNDYGGMLVAGSTLTMVGGSVEGNGQTVNDFGICATDSGREGAVGVNFSGVYFEGNMGKADVWLPNAAQNVAHNFSGCTFNRIYGDRYTKNNIFLETANGFLQTLAVTGCGFKGFGDYPTDASRKYIDGVTSAGGGNLYTLLGNMWGQGVGIPTVTQHLGI